jgi:Holliday junction resolvase RusA-like endonuclease
MRHEFFIPMARLPTVTHQEKDITFREGTGKNGKKKILPIVYEGAELKAVRQLFTDHLSGHIPDVMFAGPLSVVVKWCFPCTGNHKPGDWKTTKPDTHNLNKLPFDVMTDLKFWTDDAIVCREIIEKFYNDVPGIYIAIENL